MQWLELYTFFSVLYTLQPELFVYLVPWCRQRAVVNGSMSRLRLLRDGVPQGSVLQLVLFNMSVAESVIKHTLSEFADDTMPNGTAILSAWRRESSRETSLQPSTTGNNEGKRHFVSVGIVGGKKCVYGKILNYSYVHISLYIFNCIIKYNVASGIFFIFMHSKHKKVWKSKNKWELSKVRSVRTVMQSVTEMEIDLEAFDPRQWTV